MTVADEGWIQESLARLEELEQQKAQLEASGRTDGLAEIDAEIQALYQVLEAAAEEAEEGAGSEAPPADEASSPFAAPAAAPALDDASPFGAAAEAPAMMAAPAEAIAESYGGDDLDVRPPRSATPFVLIGLLVVGGLGAGGWYMMQNQQVEQKPAPAPTETVVIQAGAIPEDTQEPDAAQGADVDRTQGTRFKESNRPAPPRSTSSGAKPRSRPDSKKKSDDRRIVTDDSNDPLAGVK